MQINHEGIRVGKDQNGLYFLIPFSENKIEKIYLDELFEDAIENNDVLDIKISYHNVNQSTKSQTLFYDKCDLNERERIKKELDMREIYHPTRNDLNVYKYLLNYHKNHPPIMQCNANSIDEHKNWSAKVIPKIKELINYQLGDNQLDIEPGPETDIHDLMAARAPKPTFIVAGKHDPIFPLEGVEFSYRKLMEVYKLYGKEENLQIDVIKGAGHMFRGDKAYSWLEKILYSN